MVFPCPLYRLAVIGHWSGGGVRVVEAGCPCVRQSSRTLNPSHLATQTPIAYCTRVAGVRVARGDPQSSSIKHQASRSRSSTSRPQHPVSDDGLWSWGLRLKHGGGWRSQEGQGQGPGRAAPQLLQAATKKPVSEAVVSHVAMDNLAVMADECNNGRGAILIEYGCGHGVLVLACKLAQHHDVVGGGRACNDEEHEPEWIYGQIGLDEPRARGGEYVRRHEAQQRHHDHPRNHNAHLGGQPQGRKKSNRATG
eukprot:scaffold14290_cov125-Isochrysis_galbana.AAC.14